MCCSILILMFDAVHLKFLNKLGWKLNNIDNKYPLINGLSHFM